jgi:glycerol-3-phosphate dehydrogenase (NAD(P)+)
VGVPVAVIGAGSFGTCLSILCAQQNDVVLWARDPETADALNRTHRNPRHLTDARIPESVHATADLAEALTGRELVICAVPSHAVREVIRAAQPDLASEAILVSTVKGIEFETGMTMSQVMMDVLPDVHHPRIVCLSGPSFASEIAQELPTVVTLACREEAFAISVQSTLSCPWFRCYSDTDVVGVEIGGALKNVIAIAVGIGDGQRQGQNSRAALMTRGLAEITRLGVRLGADPATFVGLSGMGDLVLTCTGDLSRNRRLGISLGEDRPLADILRELGEVVEGVATTRAVCRLGERLGVELPISNMVREVLDSERTPAEAGRLLMTRQLRSEKDQ